MANFKVKRGNTSEIEGTGITDGLLLLDTEAKKIYLDNGADRLPMGGNSDGGNVMATRTIYCSPTGNPISSGLEETNPTTLIHALETCGNSAGQIIIVLEDGTYNTGDNHIANLNAHIKPKASSNPNVTINFNGKRILRSIVRFDNIKFMNHAPAETTSSNTNVYIRESIVKFFRCTFDVVGDYWAVQIYENSQVGFDSCIFNDSNYGSVYVSEGSYADIERCTFAGNGMYDMDANNMANISYYSCTTNRASGHVVTRNRNGGYCGGGLSQLTENLTGCVFTTEGSGASTKYYIQKGADTASKKLLGSSGWFRCNSQTLTNIGYSGHRAVINSVDGENITNNGESITFHKEGHAVILVACEYIRNSTYLRYVLNGTPVNIFGGYADARAASAYIELDVSDGDILAFEHYYSNASSDRYASGVVITGYYI